MPRPLDAKEREGKYLAGSSASIYIAMRLRRQSFADGRTILSALRAAPDALS